MAHRPFTPGDIVSNDEMRKAFKIGNMGGMRKSNTYNCLVIISDHTKGLYEDRWYSDELHYTRMGKVGDQVLTGNQNGTLYYSRTNGIEVHLFEVLKAQAYIYRGVVTLAGDPYQETQLDENGDPRKVWMFPLKVTSGVPIVTEQDFEESQKARRTKAEKMVASELHKMAVAHSTDKPGRRTVSSVQYVRDPFVSEYAKSMAKGICELCNQPAPFKDKKDKPYLETHHIVRLADGGADSIHNTVALCPNCHRKMHIVNDQSDVKTLVNVAKKNAAK